MENKKELPKTLDPSELGDIAGGKIFFVMHDFPCDAPPYVVVSDDMLGSPEYGLGMLDRRHEVLGEYCTAEEAIEASIYSGRCDVNNTEITVGTLDDVNAYLLLDQ